jgi:dTMP kinase
MSPIYVVVEGPDGVGKTVTAALLAERLQRRGKRVLAVREPGTTAAGTKIREVLLNGNDLEPLTQFYLFHAARIELLKWLQTAAVGYDYVVFDRFYHSSYAYQIRGDLLPDSIWDSTQLDLCRYLGLTEVRTALLMLPDNERQKRLSARAGSRKDAFESKPPEYQQRVREAYYWTIAAWPNTMEFSSLMPCEQVVSNIICRMQL